MKTADILAAIDAAVSDAAVGPDAMRGNATRPEPRRIRRTDPQTFRVAREVPGSYYPFGEGPGFTVGQIVHRFDGPMYGCMAPGEVAVSAVPNQAPFWGVPADALEEWAPDTNRLMSGVGERACRAALRMISDLDLEEN